MIKISLNVDFQQRLHTNTIFDNYIRVDFAHKNLNIFIKSPIQINHKNFEKLMFGF